MSAAVDQRFGPIQKDPRFQTLLGASSNAATATRAAREVLAQPTNAPPKICRPRTTPPPAPMRNAPPLHPATKPRRCWRRSRRRAVAIGAKPRVAADRRAAVRAGRFELSEKCPLAHPSQDRGTMLGDAAKVHRPATAARRSAATG